MRIEFIVVGRTRLAWVQAGESYYVKRLQRYARYSQVALAAEKGADISRAIEKESQRILDKLSTGPRTYTVLLADDGRQFTSDGLAERIDQLAQTHGPALRFVIGGAFGVSSGVRHTADECISLSPMTLPHELVRVVFLEQLYRAFTILRGEAYHHG